MRPLSFPTIKAIKARGPLYRYWLTMFHALATYSRSWAEIAFLNSHRDPYVHHWSRTVLSLLPSIVAMITCAWILTWGLGAHWRVMFSSAYIIHQWDSSSPIWFISSCTTTSLSPLASSKNCAIRRVCFYIPVELTPLCRAAPQVRPNDLYVVYEPSCLSLP